MDHSVQELLWEWIWVLWDWIWVLWECIWVLWEGAPISGHHPLPGGMIRAY